MYFLRCGKSMRRRYTGPGIRCRVWVDTTARRPRAVQLDDGNAVVPSRWRAGRRLVGIFQHSDAIAARPTCFEELTWN